jgi:hypothetical protein
MYLKQNKDFAKNLFKNAESNNLAYWPKDINNPLPAGVTIKYVFPDGSTITRTNTIEPIQSTSPTSNGTTTISPDSYVNLGGNNYQDTNTWTDSVGVEWITNNLYTDFNPVISSDGTHYNINIYNVSAGASSFGIGVGATYNGDKQILGNWGPYSSDQATFSDVLGVQDVGTSWTEQLVTSFNGYSTSQFVEEAAYNIG